MTSEYGPTLSLCENLNYGLKMFNFLAFSIFDTRRLLHSLSGLSPFS